MKIIIGWTYNSLRPNSENTLAVKQTMFKLCEVSNEAWWMDGNFSLNINLLLNVTPHF